jgi:phenylpyruvate tautomerase PptA (4-oxalocrotonate tautomerase family)
MIERPKRNLEIAKQKAEIAIRTANAEAEVLRLQESSIPMAVEVIEPDKDMSRT